MNTFRKYYFKSIFLKQKKFLECYQFFCINKLFSNKANFSFNQEVFIAKKKQNPIVALESAVITHGLPYPDNMNTALELEDIIRKKGGTPATIAVLNGVIKVGLSKTEFEKLAKQRNNQLLKISRRDLSFAISQGLSGGTTISSTIAIAKAMKVPVIATGGIGGVHRDSDRSMDISADLKQLGETSVAVVCSGIKSLLDVPKTLEYLETISVPVITIGSSAKFPAFFCQETYEGLDSHLHLRNIRTASEVIAIENYLQSEIGTLIAIPVPKNFSMKPEEVEKIIEKIRKKTETMGISGQNVTPFFLQQLSELTSNHTKHSNIALLKNNAEVAAELAICLNLKKRKKYIFNKYSDSISFNNKTPVC